MLGALVSAQPATAGRPSLNARSLEALGAARLAELLLASTPKALPLLTGPWRWLQVI